MYVADGRAALILDLEAELIVPELGIAAVRLCGRLCAQDGDAMDAGAYSEAD